LDHSKDLLKEVSRSEEWRNETNWLRSIELLRVALRALGIRNEKDDMGKLLEEGSERQWSSEIHPS